jgi:hypothetical protein
MSTRGRPAPGFGAVRMGRALVLAGCGVLTVSVSACESTEQESAKIGRESQVAAARAAAPQTGPGRVSSRHSSGRAHGARGGRGKSRGRAG